MALSTCNSLTLMYKQQNKMIMRGSRVKTINRHITPLKHIYFNKLVIINFVILIHNQSHKIVNK